MVRRRQSQPDLANVVPGSNQVECLDGPRVALLEPGIADGEDDRGISRRQAPGVFVMAQRGGDFAPLHGRPCTLAGILYCRTTVGDHARAPSVPLGRDTLAEGALMNPCRRPPSGRPRPVIRLWRFNAV